MFDRLKHELNILHESDEEVKTVEVEQEEPKEDERESTLNIDDELDDSSVTAEADKRVLDDDDIEAYIPTVDSFEDLVDEFEVADNNVIPLMQVHVHQVINDDNLEQKKIDLLKQADDVKIIKESSNDLEAEAKIDKKDDKQKLKSLSKLIQSMRKVQEAVSKSIATMESGFSTKSTFYNDKLDKAENQLSQDNIDTSKNITIVITTLNNADLKKVVNLDQLEKIVDEIIPAATSPKEMKAAIEKYNTLGLNDAKLYSLIASRMTGLTGDGITSKNINLELLKKWVSQKEVTVSYNTAKMLVNDGEKIADISYSIASVNNAELVKKLYDEYINNAKAEFNKCVANIDDVKALLAYFSVKNYVYKTGLKVAVDIASSANTAIETDLKSKLSAVNKFINSAKK